MGLHHFHHSAALGLGMFDLLRTDKSDGVTRLLLEVMQAKPYPTEH